MACVELVNKNFAEFKINRIVDKLIEASSLTDEGKPVVSLDDEKRMIFALKQSIYNSPIILEYYQKLYFEEKLEMASPKKIIDDLFLNSYLGMSLETVKDLLKPLLGENNELDLFKYFSFSQKNFRLSILLTTFMEVTEKEIEKRIDDVENYLISLFDLYENRVEKVLDEKSFENLMKKHLITEEYEWKIRDYFRCISN